MLAASETEASGLDKIEAYAAYKILESAEILSWS